MSAGAERPPAERPAGLPPAWARLEQAAQEAITALDTWRNRAGEAEAEVVRLRSALEEALAELPEAPGDVRERLRRLRAENAALRSRIGQAQRRIGALLEWADTLGDES